MNPTVKNLCAGILGVAFCCSLATAAPPAGSDKTPRNSSTAKKTLPSADAQHIAAWAVHSGDHKGLPFIVIDKPNARAAAFDRHGKFLDSTPVLLGMGMGDVMPPGVAQMDMYQTQPAQRVTPAGRYLAEEGKNLEGETVLWIDYDLGIALHKIPSKRTKQRRHERMVAFDPAQHRITYGCVNVWPAFYDRVVAPHFRSKGGIVYVLPDSTPLKSVFKTYEVDTKVLFNTQHARVSATERSVMQ